MPSGKPSTPATEPVPLSTDFCADDADVIIRAAGTLDFRVHKFILSFVSPIFKDMFTLRPPLPDTPNSLPRIDVQGSAKAWENILRTIYPNQPNPTIYTLDDLESVLLAAQAYEMQFVIETHRKAFEHREFIEKDPLRLYTIACACRFEDEVAYVARNAELLAVTRRSDINDLKGLTLDTYRRLVSFLADRDNQWDQAFGDVIDPRCYNLPCKHKSDSIHRLSGDLKRILRQPFLQPEEVYLKALEVRLRCQTLECPQSECLFAESGIEKFVQRMIEEREALYSKLQPAKWYCKCMTLLHPDPLIEMILIRFT